MRHSKTIICIIFLFLVFVSCAPEKEKVAEVKKEGGFVEQKITNTTFFKNDVHAYDQVVGVAGVLDVPEMLVLSIMDSAETKNVSSALIKNYALLEEEMTAIGAEMNGPIGMITYNNSPENFVFESTLFIKYIPSIQPKRCKIVVLESSKMLVYNFYGSYRNLFGAYDKIKRYCEKNDLLQSGPMREFYITDPEKEKDETKWLTRIMLPVISMRKK